MTAREKFVGEVLRHKGEVVLWGALDCSELVALGIKYAGGPDQSKTHTAQRYFDETPALTQYEFPKAGDLGFYGLDGKRVIHVVIFIAPGQVLSADGARPSIKTAEAAMAAGARVRLHTTEHYRQDVPWLGWHRNVYVDRLETTKPPKGAKP